MPRKIKPNENYVFPLETYQKHFMATEEELYLQED